MTDKTDYKKIVWLASYPKSGNTWVRCFLDAYFLGDIDINEILSSVPDDRAPAHQIGDGSKVQDMRFEIQALTRPMALLRVVRNYLGTTQEIPLFVKTHNANLLINGAELMPEVLTKATIFIVRDPKDVLPSFSNHMGVDLDKGLEWMEDKYRMLGGKKNTVIDFLSSWKDHTNSYLNCDTHNILVIRYEDMKIDPVGAFSKILAHAGVEVDEERVKKAVEIVRLDNLQRQEDKKGFNEASPKASKFFGAKHEEVTIKQKNRIEKVFSSAMKRLGYLKSKAT